jgi:CBS domain-containing protein
MTKNVSVIHFDHTVEEAAQMMERLDCGSLPIERDERMIGMITDRDIAIRCVAHSKDPRQLKVMECMTEGIDWCYDDEHIDDLAVKMSTHRIRRIPVVNRDKKLVGMVSLSDVAVRVNNPKLTHDIFTGVSHH